MKQLCPDYRRIADRCTGPAARRPKDADSLLKSLDRHDRRPKIIIAAASAAALIAAGAALCYHYLTLSDATRLAQERVTALTETNLMHAKRVAQLTDSLTDVTGRMQKAESEIQRVGSYNESRAKAYIEGCRKIENTLKNFETEILPYLDDPSPLFYDKVGVLRKQLQYICDQAFDPEKYPDLREDEKFKLREELQDHYFSVYSSYYMDWQAKFYRDEVSRNWGPDNYAHDPDSVTSW